MENYTPTIGLEVHAELKTNSKMFCGCTNDPHVGEPNAYTCPVCLAHPGTLPVVNKTAVEHVIKFGVAIGAHIATYSEFDRKNYFYPDIPKAYQISQYAFPFVSGGTLGGIAITRVHLEEDTARSQHDAGSGSVVDFNRAGVPLMELVTEPVIHDGKTAANFAKELQLILRTLGISDANMERGEMRVEANISVSKTDELGTKVEVKNLNSFRSVESAIQYEIKRQIKVLEEGGAVHQETRGWDENRDKTFAQRSKETAMDYRYFPDPDIPKMQLTEVPDFSESRLREIIPKMPKYKRTLYTNLGLTKEQIEIIIADRGIDEYFAILSELVGSDMKLLKLCANYLVTDLAPVSKFSSATMLSPEHFFELMQMVQNAKVNSRTAKDLIAEFASRDSDLKQVAEDRELIQSNSVDDLLPTVTKIIVEHAAVVEEYRAGKEASLQFLVGQGMKLTRGTANPQVLAEVLQAEIQKL